MTTITHLYAPKGGQGVSTTTALLAASADGETLVVDAAPVHDLPAILGTFYDPDDGPQRIRPGLTLGYGIEPDVTTLINGDLNFDQVFIDHGIHAHSGDWAGRTRHRWIMVVRPCYLALRAAATHETAPDGIILVREPGRALDRVDIERTIGAPVILALDHDPSISRSVDAGILLARHHQIRIEAHA